MPVKKRTSSALGKRSYIRFNPDLGLIAWIDLNYTAKTFKPKIPGLILNESFQGCALVILDDPFVDKGVGIRVQVGKMGALRAEIRWKKKISPGVVKVGVAYLT